MINLIKVRKYPFLDIKMSLPRCGSRIGLISKKARDTAHGVDPMMH